MVPVGAFLLLALASSAFAVCPPGSIYESLYNKCYKYTANPLNFLSAEKACEKIGGSLVAVQNAYENSYISGIAGASSPSPNYWIGANLLMATQWTWSSGFNGTYMNWAAGQPSDPSVYQCAAMRDIDNAWTKELCSTQKPYMCQIDPNANPVTCDCSTTTSYPITNPTTPGNPSSCPNGACDPGYTLNPDVCKCYKLSYDAHSHNTYNVSVAACQAENATLAIIRSAAENAWITSFLLNATENGSNPLLGLLCPTSSHSSCKWQDGTDLEYSNFAPGAGYVETTVYIDEINSNGRWLSGYTDEYSYAVFCEKPGYPNRAAFPRITERKAKDLHLKPSGNNKKLGHNTTDRKI